MPDRDKSSDNGIATCGLYVQRHGWLRGALCSWGEPRPIGSHLAQNAVVTDYDRGAMLQSASSELYLQKGDGTRTRIFRQRFVGDTPSYFNFDDVIKQFVAEVGYGETVMFEYLLSPVVLSFVDLAFPDGTTQRMQDVELSVDDKHIYRQHQDTQSWGSDSQKILFWPYSYDRYSK